jgi:hypothetical protein
MARVTAKIYSSSARMQGWKRPTIRERLLWVLKLSSMLPIQHCPLRMVELPSLRATSAPITDERVRPVRIFLAKTPLICQVHGKLLLYAQG